MGKCEVCGQEMITADGCYVSTVHINGKVYERIPYYGDFDEEDEKALLPCFDTAIEIIKSFVLAGINITMNQYNHKHQGKPSK